MVRAMRSFIRVIAVLVLLALVFPPVERRVEGVPVAVIDGAQIGGVPDRSVSDGFRFIGAVGPRHRIAVGQWVVEIGALALAGVLLGLSDRANRSDTSGRVIAS
jgi:hypothetical protein